MFHFLFTTPSDSKFHMIVKSWRWRLGKQPLPILDTLNVHLLSLYLLLPSRVNPRRLDRFDLAAVSAGLAVPAAAVWPDAEPTIATGLADAALVVVDVWDTTHGGGAVSWDDNFALGRQTHHALVVLLAQQQRRHTWEIGTKKSQVTKSYVVLFALNLNDDGKGRVEKDRTM